MSLEEPKFLDYMKNMFSKYGADFDLIKGKFYEVFNSSPTKRDELPILGHFYYFICTPNDNKAREELQIVGIVSLIEAMMSDIKHKTPFEYFEEISEGKNSIDDFIKFREEYYEKYGMNKKIIEYFKKYIPKEKADDILSGIEKITNKGKNAEPLKDLEALAKFLSRMRSDFVHQAEMRFFCPPHCIGAWLKIGVYSYNVKVNISTLLEIFEESFVAYWVEKYKLLLDSN